jgi:hypothetical protein
LAGLVGVGFFATYLILLGSAPYLFILEESWTVAEPTTRARVLAENISSLMNCSAWGAPLGLLLGVAFFIRGWRASRVIRLKGEG